MLATEITFLARFKRQSAALSDPAEIAMALDLQTRGLLKVKKPLLNRGHGNYSQVPVAAIAGLTHEGRALLSRGE